MKFSILSLLNVIFLINAEYSSYKQFAGNFMDYDKYSHDEETEIPSLKSLFNFTTYRDKSNKTSPCLFEGSKRDIHCEMVSYFDEQGYEKSLQDTRNFILNRLNLDSEPEVKINKNTLSFLDQLENKILSGDQKANMDYDNPSSSKKIFNTIHEAVVMTPRCTHSKYSTRDNSNLCITFEIPTKNFLSSKGILRRTTAAYLWLFIRTQSSYESGIDENFHLEISNGHEYSEIIYNLRNGWKKINVSKIFKLMAKKISKVFNFTIKLRCFYDCSISYTDRDVDNYFYDDTTNILISNFPGKKPLLSIDIEEENELEKKRNKRKISSNGDRNFRSARHNGHMTKICRPSSGIKEHECCLNQYQVDFDRIKWSSWIIHPHSYSANFCSGGCNDQRSIYFYILII